MRCSPLLCWPLKDNLTTQIARHIRDVNPSAISLPYQLSKPNLSLLLHLKDEFEQATVVSLVACYDVGSAAEHVVAVLHTSDERVEFLAAVSRGDHYRFTPRFAYGIEQLVY